MSKRSEATPLPALIEELEPRLLLSADGLAALGAVVSDDEQALDGRDGDVIPVHQEFLPARFQEQNSSVVDAEAVRRELVFIDAGIADHQALVDGFLHTNGAELEVDVVVLDPARDGIEQISAALAGYQDLDAVHLLSHGNDASLRVGATTLDADSLQRYRNAISGWGEALGDEADLLLYGCNLASSAAGERLVDTLAGLTGADVAASDDLTGQVRLGGDWNLEYTAGRIEAHAAPALAVQQSFDQVLLTENAQASQDSYIQASNPTTNAGSSDTLTIDREDNDLQRALFQFDLSAIPTGAAVSSATLKLEASSSGTMNVGVYQVLESWSEGSVTWNESSSGTAWSTPGSAFDATALDTVVAGAAGQQTFDITSLVQDWVDGSTPNFGVMLGSPDGGGDRTLDYDSREGNVKPVLEVVYTGTVITSDGAGATAVVPVAENTTAVTTVTADNPGGPPVVYSIAGGADAGLFDIDGSSGELTFLAPPDFEARADADADNVYDVVVQAFHPVGGTDTQTLEVTVTNVDEPGVNDAPENTLPGAQTIERDGMLVFAAAAGTELSVSDFDAGSNPIEVQLTASNGTLNLSGTNGLSFTLGDGSADTDMTFTGSIADINAALEGATFVVTPGFVGAASVQIRTDDKGFGEPGGPLVDTDTVDITVAAPEISVWTSGSNNSAVGPAYGNLAWHKGQVVGLSDPNLALGTTTNGTFVSTIDFNALPGDGNVNILGLHHVSRETVVGAANSITLQAGDVLFSVDADEVLGGVTIEKADIGYFRPDVPGDYSSGTFGVLVHDAVQAGKKVFGLTLAETATSVGGTVINAGELLLVSETAKLDIQRYVPNDLAVPGDGATTLLVEGGDIGISKEIWSLHLVSSDVTVGSLSLSTGQLVLNINSNSTVGDNTLAVEKFDAFALTVSQTELSGTPGLSAATASVVLDGGDVDLTAGGEEFDALTMVNDNSGPTTVGAAYNIDEHSAGGTVVGSVSATDPELLPLAYAIIGGNTGGAFAIDAATGQITVANSAALDFETTPVFNLTVAAVDDRGAYDTATVTVTLNDVNDAPTVALANVVTTMPEDTDTASRIRVADIVVSDDALGTNTLSLSGADSALFEIDSGSLYLVAGASLDFESNPNLDVTVAVDDASLPGTPDDTAALAISVTDVNEAPTVSLANVTATFVEDTDTTSRIKVADIVVTDDASGTNTLSLAGADAALFEIDGTELFLVAGATLDFETNPSLDVTVQVDDAALPGAPDDTAPLAIAVTDVNEPPTVSLANVVTTMPEDTDTSSRIRVADIVVTDDALGTNTLSLSGADAALFEIDSGSLYLIAGASLDFESNPTLDVTLEVDDAALPGSPEDTAALAISVTDVNDPPTVALTNVTATFAEDTDTASRIKVADIVVTDDPSGTNSLSLAGADAALFEIDGTELFLVAGAGLDFETNPSLDVTVQVDDASLPGTPDDTAPLAIAVTDVNEPPTVSLANVTSTMPEDTDTSSRIKVADIVVSDDALGTNTLSLAGVDAALFELDSGALYLIAGASLDFETNPSLDVTVQVDDAALPGSPEDTAALAISVTDVNEPPSVALANVTTTLSEATDTTSRVKVADIVVTDDPAGTNVLSLSGADAALFEIDGTELFLVAGAALDFETNATLDVTVEVDDVALPAMPEDSAPLSITVTDANDAPVLDASGAMTLTSIFENQTNSLGTLVSDIIASALGNRITDQDGDPEGVAITSVDDSNGTWQYSTDGGGSWFAIGSVSDASARLLTATAMDRIRFVPDTAFNGTASFTFRAWDTTDGGASGDSGVDASTNGGSSAFSAVTESAAIQVAPVDVKLYMSTAGDVAGAGTPGTDTWAKGDVIAIGDPGFALEAAGAKDGSAEASAGTLYSATSNFLNTANTANSDVLGEVQVSAMHYVGQDVTVGNTTTIDLLKGDLLLAVSHNSATFQGTDLVSVTVGREDVLVLRPDVQGEYGAGSFFLLFDDVPGGGEALTGISLAEKTTVVGQGGGARSLDPGTLLYSREGDSFKNNIYIFEPDEVGATTTGLRGELLLEGNAIGLGATGGSGVGISGFSLVDTAVTVDGVSLNEGTILVTLDGNDGAVGNIGATAAGDENDIYAIDIANTGAGSTAEATLFYDGNDVGLNNSAERIDALAVLIDTMGAQIDPTLTIGAGSLTFTEDDGPTVIAPGATVSDADSPDFSGGSLRVELIANGTANDRLSVEHQGGGIGQVGVSGDLVQYEGATVGTLSGGVGTTALVITFNSIADDAAVAAVARAVTYDNVSGDPSTATRTVQFQLTDGDGGTSGLETKSIDVVAVNDNPVITSAATAAVVENTTAVMTVTATDPETDPLTYHITGGDDAAFFAIDSASGALSFRAPPDFEGPADADGDNAYLVEVTARDGVGNDGSMLVTVNVGDVNEVPVAADWYHPDWQQRKTVTVDAAKVAGSLRDFPVLVSIAADPDLAARALANGDDILFTSADGTTKLSHEIEAYNGVTGELRVWVKTDLSAGVDTVLHLYYGNAGAAPQEDPANVWDSNQLGVWHLEQAPDANALTQEILDSSGNDQHGDTEGAMDASDLVTAKIGQGIDFDSVDAGLIRIPDSVTLDTTAAGGTFSLWINFDDAADGDHQIVMSSSNRYTGGANDGFEWASQGGGNHFFYPWGGDNSNYNMGANPFTDGQWHHLAVTFDFDQRDASIVVDGDEISYSDEFVATYWDTLANPDDWLWGGNPDRGTRYFDGAMDEIRVSNVARSAAWIKTSYTNQWDAPAFVTVGAEQARTFTVAEDAANDTTVGFAYGFDNDDDSLTYSIAGGNTGNAFKINASSGEIQVNDASAIDYETLASYTLTVQVMDPEGETDSATFDITVTDVNEAPAVSLANVTTTFAEDTDTSSAIKVADIVVSDDALGTNNLTLSGADAALFEIVGTELRLIAGASLDFETNSSLDVTVEVDDPALAPDPNDSASMAITVTDVNEAPTVSLANVTPSFAEDTDTSVRIKVADIVISDDALGTNNLTLSGADAALFEIDGTELFLVAGASLDFETNPSLDVTVEVDDPALAPDPNDSASMGITVTDVNEAPTVGLANVTTTFAEDIDTSSAIKVADIVISDDALGTNNLTLSGADAALFEIVGTELRLIAGASLDFETNPSLDVTVEVDDPALAPDPNDSASMSIMVTDANDAPTVSLANVTLSFAEDTDTTVRIKVADIVLSDDALGTNNLTLSGADAALFQIDGTELFLVAGASLDFETNPSLDVTVEVDDPALAPDPNDTVSMSITVTDVNEAPTVSLANVTLSFAEDTDTSGAIKVADIVVSDDALGTNNLTLSGADAALFEIVGTELRLIAGASLDFETNPSLDVTVEVDDPALAPAPNDTASMSITVTDVNEAPTVSLANVTLSFAEDTDTSSAIKVADIVIGDDALGTNNLTLSGADAALFEIVGTELRLIAGASLDFETNPSLDVTVEVDDPALAPDPNDSASMTITVTDVNEAPTVSLANVTLSFAEDTDTSSAIKVADIVVSDDALGTNNLTLSGADAALFEIVGTELRLIAGAALDFETNPSLDVTVEVDDPALAPAPNDTASMSITVTDVNEAPTVSLANVTLSFAEDTDTSSAIKVADIVIGDDALGTNNLTLSGADAALFEIVGTELRLIAGASLDFETNPSLDVTVEVDDPALAPDPNDTVSMSITVTDVNEAPTVSLANVTLSFAEDTDTSSAIKVADIVVSDDALGTNNLTLSGADAALFEIVGTELRLIAGASLDFETNPSLDVTVEVDDPALAPDPNDSASMTITVTDVNEAPTVSLANVTPSFAEDTDTSVRIKVADIVISDDALGTNNLTLSGADAALFEIDGTELFLVAGASLDFETNPSLDVTVEVDDPALAPDPNDSASITITVTDANEAPTVSLANVTLSFAEDTDTSSAIKVADIVISDDALGTNNLTLSGADAALFEIVGTELRLVAGAALDFESNPALDVTVEVDDLALAPTPDDTAAMTITVTDANEAPTVSLANVTLSFAEDTDTSSAIKVADIVISDDALGTNNLTLSGADAALFEIVGTELRLIAGASLDFETNPALDVTVEVDDPALAPAPNDTASMSITVTDVNEAPTVSLANMTLSFAEDTDTSSAIKVADIVVSDDALGTNNLSLSGADAALFEIVGTELRLIVGASLDFETNPSLDVTVEVDDPALAPDPNDSASMSITVTDVNEAPTVSLANVTLSFAEDTDTSSAIKVADIVVSDDALGTNNLTLSGADAALFEIVGTELRLIAGASLDFETNPSLDVTVEVDDPALAPDPNDTVSMSITVTDVNEAPTVSLANVTLSFAEDTDTSSAIKVADIVIGDDALGTNNLTLSGADAALFEIVGTELRLVAGASLDFETNPSLDVTLEVDDPALAPDPNDSASMTITITDANDAPGGAPVVTGTAAEDQTLGVDATGISDEDGLGPFSYQWLRDGVGVTGATGSTYTLGDADVGARFSVRVSYTDGNGVPEAVTSVQTAPVANVNDAPLGIPVVSGSSQLGETLTVDVSRLSDADGLGTLSFQWLRDGVALPSATGATYTLTAADEGSRIAVAVSYTDTWGTPEGPIASAQTAPVTAPPAPQPAAEGTPPPADNPIEEEVEPPVTPGPVELAAVLEPVEEELSEGPAAEPDLTGALSRVPGAESGLLQQVVLLLDAGDTSGSSGGGTAATRAVADARAVLLETARAQALERMQAAPAAEMDGLHRTSPALVVEIERMTMEMVQRGEQEIQDEEFTQNVVKGTLSTLSVGSLTWLLRAGSLLTGLFSAIPMWSSMDPLPVLFLSREEKRRRQKEMSKARAEDVAEQRMGRYLGDAGNEPGPEETRR